MQTTRPDGMRETSAPESWPIQGPWYEYGCGRVDETTRHGIQGYGNSLQTFHLGRETWIDGSSTPVAVFRCAFNQGLIDLARDWFVIVRAGGGGNMVPNCSQKRHIQSRPR